MLLEVSFNRANKKHMLTASLRFTHCITVLQSYISYSDLCLQWGAGQHCHLDKEWWRHFRILPTLPTSTELDKW